MLVTTFTSMGQLGTNCYVVESELHNGIMIDCPCMAQSLYEQLDKYGVTLKKILLTHGHIDHIGAAAELSALTGACVLIHHEDRNMLCSKTLNLAAEFGMDYTQPEHIHTFDDDALITLDELSIAVMHTPGHTPGSCCFFVDEFMFSGDTLFAGSIGRTDFSGGDMLKMGSSLRSINEIPADYRVMPGHGPETRLSAEKQNNLYLSGRIMG